MQHLSCLSLSGPPDPPPVDGPAVAGEKVEAGIGPGPGANVGLGVGPGGGGGGGGGDDPPPPLPKLVHAVDGTLTPTAFDSPNTNDC